jgi:hypothetical protein
VAEGVALHDVLDACDKLSHTLASGGSSHSHHAT